MMIRILHLSDIHLDRADLADTFRSQLEADLKQELNVDRLDYLVVSGDITIKSTPEEYDAAEKLFNGIISRFEIKRENIIMVPGNHDLNWDNSKKGYRLMDRQDHDGKLEEGEFITVNEEVIRIRVPAAYRERFRHFSEFHQHITDRPYPLEYPKQGIVYPFEHDKVLFLGLNSSWEIDHHYQDRAGIHPNALSNAIDRLMELGCHDWLKISVCHHPVSGPEMMKKVDFLERLSRCGFQVLMHGHIHEAQQGFYNYDTNRQIHIVGSGTFGAPTRDLVPGVPYQYHLFEYESERSSITVRSRKKVKVEGAWSADPCWGDKDDPVSFHSFPLKIKVRSSVDAAAVCTLKPNIMKKETLEVPAAYQEWVLDWCGHMDVDRIQDKGLPITVSLPEVFVNLFTTSSGKSEDKEVPDPEALLKMKEHTRDVEDVIAENHDLVIRGEAGSGKTTLLKHFVYMCFKEPGWKGMNEILPVLVFLKDLKTFQWENRPQNEETAEALLRHSFRETGCGLDMETVRQYCSAGKALFLLDGLDEIEIDIRNLVVNSLTRYRRVCKGGRFVFSGRPHGVDGDVVKRFSDQIVTILPFTMDQVNTFIDKWFRGMKQTAANQVSKTAEEMISEVRDNPGIEKLIYNPLMLTAVCILYFDQKELPGQRAELYKKFVENMLHRGKRFKDPERIHSFLMALAHANHIQRRKGCDRNTALTILGKIYPKKKRTDVDYRIFLQKTFERIEPDCGLLKFDAGQLIFRHLTFQEFLTAEYIKDREKLYDQAIQGFWEDEWYKEVVELLIGLLSIDSRQWANDMVKGALTLTDKPPYLRFRLGARSILDIHSDRRDHDVVDLATEKMREIIVSRAAPKERADAGEILGRLGDRRELEKFIRIPDGGYETSVGTVVLKDFHMAQYPVSNQWFKKFIKDGGYENHSFWSPEGLKWLEYTGAKQPWLWHDRSWNCPNHPVVGVCWWEADAFCRWLTAVKDDGCLYCLPTEKQWEATAAGLKKREYPWGQELDADKCNTEETKIERTSAVGIFKDGQTPEGIGELAGNVWEWTKTSYHGKVDLTDFRFELDAQGLYEKWLSATGDEKKDAVESFAKLWSDEKRQFPVIRGGSWDDGSVLARCADRLSYFPGLRSLYLGFRCSRIER